MQEKFQTINDLIKNNFSKNIAIAYVQGGLKPKEERYLRFFCDSGAKWEEDGGGRRGYFEFNNPQVDAKNITKVQTLATSIIGEIEKKYPKCKKITLIGYSQGAMLAIAIPFLITQDTRNKFDIDVIALRGGVMNSLKEYINIEKNRINQKESMQIFAIKGGLGDPVIPDVQFKKLKIIHAESKIYEDQLATHSINNRDIEHVSEILKSLQIINQVE